MQANVTLVIKKEGPKDGDEKNAVVNELTRVTFFVAPCEQESVGSLLNLFVENFKLHTGVIGRDENGDIFVEAGGWVR